MAGACVPSAWGSLQLPVEDLSMLKDDIKMIKSWPAFPCLTHSLGPSQAGSRGSVEGALIQVSHSPTSSWLPSGCSRARHQEHKLLQHVEAGSQSGVPGGSAAFLGAKHQGTAVAVPLAPSNRGTQKPH